jgi:hypothetical protein
MLRCAYDGVMIMKPGYQTTENTCVKWLDESSFTVFPTSGRVYIWRTSKEAHNPEYRVPKVKLERFCDYLGNNIVVQYSVGPIITLHDLITTREYVDGLGN